MGSSLVALMVTFSVGIVINFGLLFLLVVYTRRTLFRGGTDTKASTSEEQQSIAPIRLIPEIAKPEGSLECQDFETRRLSSENDNDNGTVKTTLAWPWQRSNMDPTIPQPWVTTKPQRPTIRIPTLNTSSFLDDMTDLPLEGIVKIGHSPKEKRELKLKPEGPPSQESPVHTTATFDTLISPSDVHRSLQAFLPGAQTSSILALPRDTTEPKTVAAAELWLRDDADRDVFFRVMSYNIRCDKDAPPFAWLQRKRYIRDAIVDGGAQVLCLQEAKDKYAQELVWTLGAEWRMSGVPRRENDEGTQIAYNSNIFTYMDSSTWVFHDEGVRKCPPASPCTEPSFLGRRKCAHVRIFTHTLLVHKDTNAPVNFINTHFPLEIFEQDICARQLAEFIQQRTDTHWPTIVCGDFNSHYPPDKSGTPLARLLEGVPGLRCAHELKDFPTYKEGFGHNELQPELDGASIDRSHRLDYILARVPPDFPLAVNYAEVQHPRYKGSDGLLYRPSDHEVLVADFKVSIWE
jgi:endonuclease/exonuclease/phosphatase family metal-dependent hydrolase